MALVPAMDLRPANGFDLAHVPYNPEAETALLGCILYDNAAYERLGDFLRPEHFFEPFHQRLFAAIESELRKGQLAEPILLAERFQKDAGFEELGGVRYLADLVDRAPPAPNAVDYARVIYDLSLRRQLIRFSQEVGAAATNPIDDQTGRDLIELAEADLFTLGETGITGQGFQKFDHYLGLAVEMVAEAHNRDGTLAGLSTGLIDLDQKTGGLHPSDLVIIAADTSMGKTSLACNIGWSVASQYVYEVQPDGSHKAVRGGRVGFFSLEMSGEQLALRVLAEAAGVSGDRMRKGQIDAQEFGRIRDAAIQIQEAPLYIDATGGMSIAKIATRARRLKRRGGLDLLIVDYIQLATASNLRRDANRVEQISEITRGLKALAKELDIPVVALAQINRNVASRDNKKPQLSDLRESGSIEQDADMVMFVYRESYYLSRMEPKEGTDEHFKWQEAMDACRGQADLIIGKQRHGPIGTVKVAFNEDLTKFTNLARDGRYDYGRQDLPYNPGAQD